MADARGQHPKSPPDSSRIFLRLLKLLRPYWPLIGLGLLLLVLSTPCELFPALVWKYVTDDLILGQKFGPTPVLHTLISFGGHIHGKLSLLFWSMVWLFIVYAAGEVMGTLSTNLMNRVAQKFILIFRNRVHHKLQSQG